MNPAVNALLEFYNKEGAQSFLSHRRHMNKAKPLKYGQERTIFIKEHLSYDGVSGKITWKKSPNYGVSVGQKAGYIDSLGYLRISVKSSVYFGHRIAWLLAYNKWPTKIIDHINGNPSDNSLKNLREATQRENQQNQKTHRAGGLPGVYYNKRQQVYFAQVTKDKKHYFIGRFKTKDEGHSAYLKFIKKKGWE